MADIAEEMKNDPGMHVNVLKTVNSAAFGLATRVSNIHHAVSLMGRSRLESLVLSVAVKDMIPRINSPCMDSGRFWEVSAKRAGLARAFADRLHPATKAESFTAGLLLDMAMPFFIMSKKDEYCKVLENWKADPRRSLAEFEMEAFGFDHARVGGMIAQYWELPDNLVNIIASHHDLESEDLEPAVKVASFLNYDDGSDDLQQIIEYCQNEMAMDEATVREIAEDAFAGAKSLVE
jgi:HD-like signal output (HDOD) protein